MIAIELLAALRSGAHVPSARDGRVDCRSCLPWQLDGAAQPSSVSPAD